MKGFISLHRKLKDNPVWSDPNYLKLWIFCLFEATHKERDQLIGNEIVKLKRGQFITGRNSLAEKMNQGVKPKQQLNDRTWFRYLKNLEAWGMLTIKSTNKYSIVTIDKYDVYQLDANETVQRTDQQLSNKSPTVVQQLSTNNNVNNVNNDNKYITTTNNARENDAIVFYQENIGMIRPVMTHDLLNWIKDMGDEMVIEALKRSIERNKPHWSYAKSILQSWREKNIRTIEQANAEDVAFRNQQKTNYSRRNYQSQKPEVLPDWFTEQKQQAEQQAQSEQVDEDEEAKMLAMLAQHAKE